MPNPTTSVSNWERATKRVSADVRTGDYVNAETALVVVGPPRLTDIGNVDANINNNINTRNVAGNTFGAAGAGDALFPVGMVEALSIQQGQTVQKMYEIGSRRSYQAGGRVQVGGSIGRVLFNGPSLLRVLYAYYPNLIAMANGKVLGALAGGDVDSIGTNAIVRGDTATRTFPAIYFEAGAESGQRPGGEPPHSFFINLMSELFSHPFGMGLILRDNKNVNYGALYLEDCMINSHSLVVSSSSTLITEAVNFQCDAVVPMEFSTGSGDNFQVAPLSAVPG